MSAFKSTASRLRGFALAALALGMVAPAEAVFIFAPLDNPRKVTLRVGSANATINDVTFTVTGANVAPNPMPVTGIPGGGAPSTSPAGGVEIEVTNQMPASTGINTMTLTVDSSVGLPCVAGSGCGVTSIPFTSIGWTSYNLDPSGGDIQDGVFDGSATQLLVTYNVDTNMPSAQSVSMKNVLVFRYDNATLYPSGQYSGRVRYTATNL